MKNDHEKSIIKKTAKKSLKEAFDVIGNTVLGPFWGIKNFIKTCYGTFKELNFDEFIKSIYLQFEFQNATEEAINSYIEKLQKGNGIQYISNIIDSLYFSKCILASQILGHIAAKYLVEGDLDYCDLYLVAALKDLYDSDIRMFVKFYMNNAHKGESTTVLNEYTEQERIVLDKLQNLNILGRDRTPGRFGDSVHKPIFYEKTEVSTRLFTYYKMFASIYD